MFASLQFLSQFDDDLLLVHFAPVTRFVFERSSGFGIR